MKRGKLPKLPKIVDPQQWSTEAIALAMICASDYDMLAGCVNDLRFPEVRSRRTWKLALPAFLKLFHHPSTYVREACVEVAAKAQIRDALPQIAALLSDHHETDGVHSTCAFAISWMPDLAYELLVGIQLAEAKRRYKANDPHCSKVLVDRLQDAHDAIAKLKRRRRP